MSITSPVPYVYQQAPLTTDPSVIKQNVADYMTAYMPAGFKVGVWLDLLIEAFAIEAAQQADVAQQKLDGDFRYFGSLVNLPPIDAIPSTATVTYTVKDTAGYTIPAGSAVGLMDPSGTLRGFDLVADLIIAPGSSTGAGAVIAEDAGTLTNGLSGTAQLVNTPSFVTAATMTAATGGIDAELDSDYKNRLVETFGTLSPIPVLGTNYAVLARSIAGVYRATGVNLLKPGPPYDIAAEATNVEKNVTVAVTDILGQPVGSTIRGQAQTYLRSLRESNFPIWVVDPQYNTIDVTACHVYSWPGWDTTAVGAEVTAALQAALSPATFATDPSGIAARWANDPVVHASSLYQAAMTASNGVRNVDPITFGIHSGSMGTGDVTLGAGSAIPALPQAGAITVTVTATTA